MHINSLISGDGLAGRKRIDLNAELACQTVEASR
jgi:hypothetical protein